MGYEIYVYNIRKCIHLLLIYLHLLCHEIFKTVIELKKWKKKIFRQERLLFITITLYIKRE